MQVPEVVWAYTSQDVLTMEYAPGTKINRAAELDRMGVNRKLLAKRAVESYLQQLLTFGFFHAGGACAACRALLTHSCPVLHTGQLQRFQLRFMVVLSLLRG